MRKAILTAIALSLAFTLQGCGSTQSASEAVEERIWEEENAVLEFYIWSDEETYVRQVVNAYNALKGREEVRLHVIPNAEHEEWLKNYEDSYGADILGLRGNANVVELQEKGSLLPLGHYLKESDLDVTAYGNMYNEITYAGDYYAMPTRSTCWVLYYNKTLFDEAGVPYPGHMTWQEYLELAEQMTRTDGKEPIWGGYFPPWIYHFIAIQRGYYLLDDNTWPLRESLEFLNEAYHAGTHMPYADVKDRGDDCRYDFEKGNIAMMVNGEWLVNMFLEDEASGLSVPDWDIAPVPVPEGVEYGTTVGMYQFAAITTTCQYPDEAFAFLEFLCGEQGAKIYARNAIIPAYSNEEILEIYVDAAGTEQAAVFFEAKRVQEQPMWNGYDKLLELFKEESALYLEGKCTLDEALEDFEKKRREILR